MKNTKKKMKTAALVENPLTLPVSLVSMPMAACGLAGELLAPFSLGGPIMPAGFETETGLLPYESVRITSLLS